MALLRPTALPMDPRMGPRMGPRTAPRTALTGLDPLSRWAQPVPRPKASRPNQTRAHPEDETLRWNGPRNTHHPKASRLPSPKDRCLRREIAPLQTACEQCLLHLLNNQRDPPRGRLSRFRPRGNPSPSSSSGSLSHPSPRPPNPEQRDKLGAKDPLTARQSRP